MFIILYFFIVVINLKHSSSYIKFPPCSNEPPLSAKSCLLNDISNTEESQALKTSQDFWSKQNKLDNKLITLFVKNKGGTMYLQLAESDSSELKKQRAEFLKWLYEIQDIEENY